MGWYGRKWLHGGWCGWMDVAAWWVLFGHVYAMEVIGWRWLWLVRLLDVAVLVKVTMVEVKGRKDQCCDGRCNWCQETGWVSKTRLPFTESISNEFADTAFVLVSSMKERGRGRRGKV